MTNDARHTPIVSLVRARVGVRSHQRLHGAHINTDRPEGELRRTTAPRSIPSSLWLEDCHGCHPWLRLQLEIVSRRRRSGAGSGTDLTYRTESRKPEGRCQARFQSAVGKSSSPWAPTRVSMPERLSALSRGRTRQFPTRVLQSPRRMAPPGGRYTSVVSV